MEASGTAPRVGLDASDLAEVMAGEGPFLTVYLVTEGAIDNAGQRSEQRWKSLRAELADAGAPDSALELIDPLVADAHLSGNGLAVVTDESKLLLVEHLGEAPDADGGSWARLPDLVPILRWRQSQPPYLLVLADRGGADLIAQRPGRDPVERTAGTGEPDRKTSPGGWSQRRFQERAENDWARTAGDVATQLVELAGRIGARLVVLGGDVRATQMIHGDLPDDLAEITYMIDPGRAADGSEDEREREVERLVATAVAEDTASLLRKFKEERGQHDRAADGAEATVDALNQAAVDVLLLAEQPADERAAWIGAEPVPVALGPGSDVTGGATTEAPLAPALLRAAIATGATVRIVPSSAATDGVGAVLRWSAADA